MIGGSNCFHLCGKTGKFLGSEYFRCPKMTIYWDRSSALELIFDSEFNYLRHFKTFILGSWKGQSLM